MKVGVLVLQMLQMRHKTRCLETVSHLRDVMKIPSPKKTDLDETKQDTEK